MTSGLLWIDPAGNTHDMTDPTTYFWIPGATGMGMPPMDLQEQPVPLQAGSIPRLTLAKTRDVNLPIRVMGQSQAQLYNNLETLASMFYSATTQTPGTLRRTTPNGHVRDLFCYYVGGAEWNEASDNYAVDHMDMVIGLHACKPFWYDSVATIKTFSTGGLLNFFSNPFLPLQLSPSGLASAFSIINSGDDIAYPTWTIQGPATNPILTNTYTLPNGATLTKTLTFAIVLGSSDVLTIVTDPYATSIKKQDGSNQFSAMSLTSALWGFVTGVNQCAISMTGTTGATLVTLTYKQAYLAP